VTLLSQSLDWIGAIFEDPNVIANVGLLLVATVSERLGLETWRR